MDTKDQYLELPGSI